jgi:hypothetical protein
MVAMRLDFYIYNYSRLLLCAGILLMPLSAQAANGSAVPATRIENNHAVARLVFELQKPVPFTAVAKNKTITITFERKAKPDAAAILSKLYPYISSVERKPDGKTVILTMDKPYHIRKFTNKNISGIELLQFAAKPAPAKEVAKAVPNTPTKEQIAAEKAAQVIRKQVADNRIKFMNSAKNLGMLAPAAGNAAEEKKAEIEKSDDGAAHPADVDNILRDQINKVTVSAAEDSITLRFPLAERTAFSVFNRNHHLWIVLDKNLKLDLSEFEEMEKTVVGKPELIANPKATILYMPIDDNVYTSVLKEENSNNVAVLITQKKQPIAISLPVEVSTGPPAPPHVLISTLEMADPLTIRDPIIGDEIIITPLFKIGEGVTHKREFIEFDLLETTQGIALVKKADDISVLQLRNGLRITSGKGATISPDLPKIDIKNVNDGVQANPTLFPYEIWKANITETRQKQIQSMFHQIVETDNTQDANNARLKLAKLYLSEGLAPEANALLDGINRSNPAFYRTAKLNALHGAANFLMARFIESAKDFSATELNNNKEIEYWRAVLADLLGNTGQTYDYLAMNDDYISKYPPVFRQRLAIVAADRSIANKDYNIALKIFDSLHQDNLLDSINVYINFLMAKISLSTGQQKEATENLDKIAEDYKHPFVKARAEFTRIARDMDAGLEKDKAIDRLERLRLSWHGDNLELTVLTLLGELYNERKDYVNAMRVWNNGVQAFKNTAAAIEMAHKMEEVFIIMFNEGVADKLPPLEALALYYEYRNYMPNGTAGSEMVDRLADRLVSVDLLEQAAGLLDHQMRTQTEKEKRSQIGAKLAGIYLLNHQPQKTLLALQDSVYGENQATLRLTRNRLAAQAMVDMGKPDMAMQTLGQDDSTEAESIRLSIYWKAKDWDKLTASVENILKARQDITAAVTLDESEYLIKLALAYVFTDNKEQLQYLRDYFGPLMANSPNRKVFEFVTSSDIDPNSRNFDEVIQYINNTRSFIENYKAHILLPANSPAPAANTAAEATTATK